MAKFSVFLTDFFVESHLSVVPHDSASKDCKRKMAEAYALNQRLNGSVSNEDLKNLRRKLKDDQAQDSNDRKPKRRL